MSVSMTATRAPLAAKRAATFAVVLLFPVPPRNEWIEMTVVTCCPLWFFLHARRAQLAVGMVHHQIERDPRRPDSGRLV